MRGKHGSPVAHKGVSVGTDDPPEGRPPPPEGEVRLYDASSMSGL